MRAALVWVIAAYLVLPSMAQDRAASLTGKVKDVTGAGVPNTTAELESESAPISKFQAIADAAGLYRFTGLPAGDYDLKLSEPGFSRLTVKSIHILEGEQKLLPELRLALGWVADCGGQALLDHVRFLPSENHFGSAGGTVRLDEGPLVGKRKLISGAGVALICSDFRVCGLTTTNSVGEFLFAGLSPGYFSIRVSDVGFYPQSAPIYRVEEGVESFYSPIYIERCPDGNCDPKLRPKKPPARCE
jgi:Carboxypeptidase regulatory-like domain